MKIRQITIDPDPYKPFRLAQGYRVGKLLFISGQAAIDGNGSSRHRRLRCPGRTGLRKSPAGPSCRRFEPRECGQGYDLPS